MFGLFSMDINSHYSHNCTIKLTKRHGMKYKWLIDHCVIIRRTYFIGPKSVFCSRLTFLLIVMSVKMECTRQVLENIAPNANEKPAMSSQARAAQMYGNMFTLVIWLFRPRNTTLLYVNMAPMMIKLFRCGLDIFMYL